MAIAFDSATGWGRSSSTTTRSFTHVTSGSDRFLIVNCRLINGATSATATYGGVSMTASTSPVSPKANNYLISFTLMNPPVGSNTVTITANATGLIDATSASYTGVSQSSQPTIITSNTTSPTASINPSLTTVTDNSWFIVVVINTDRPMSAGTGATLRTGANGTNFNSIFDGGSAVSPAGSTSMTINASDSAGSFGWVQFAIEPAGGTPPATANNSARRQHLMTM